MLNTDIDEILYEDGKVVGVKGKEGVANAPLVICDPTYVLKCKLDKRVKFVEKVVRCICILDHPIPKTENIPSVQIIIPQRQVGRKNGTYFYYFRHLHHDGFICSLRFQAGDLHRYY
jgi:Rab GDP dissociation inhibitor